MRSTAFRRSGRVQDREACPGHLEGVYSGAGGSWLLIGCYPHEFYVWTINDLGSMRLQRLVVLAKTLTE